MQHVYVIADIQEMHVNIKLHAEIVQLQSALMEKDVDLALLGGRDLNAL